MQTSAFELWLQDPVWMVIEEKSNIEDTCSLHHHQSIMTITKTTLSKTLWVVSNSGSISE